MASIISYGAGGEFDPDTVNLKQREEYTRGTKTGEFGTVIGAAGDDFNNLVGPHITITVPKKVRIRAETADVTPKAKTECD